MVVPANGELKIGEAMQITIEFNPTILGDLQGELSINYDTGEVVHVALSGVGINLDVRLDKSELQIVPTYIGMANFKNFAINNKGNEIVKFKFSRFATEFEEQKGFGLKPSEPVTLIDKSQKLFPGEFLATQRV